MNVEFENGMLTKIDNIFLGYPKFPLVVSMWCILNRVGVASAKIRHHSS